jgi:hypothetical protein
MTIFEQADTFHCHLLAEPWDWQERLIYADFLAEYFPEQLQEERLQRWLGHWRKWPRQRESELYGYTPNGKPMLRRPTMPWAWYPPKDGTLDHISRKQPPDHARLPGIVFVAVFGGKHGLAGGIPRGVGHIYYRTEQEAMEALAIGLWKIAPNLLYRNHVGSMFT